MAESPELMVLACICGQKMKVPSDATGRTFKCVRCGAHVKVTEDNVTPLHMPAPPPSSGQDSGLGPKIEPKSGAKTELETEAKTGADTESETEQYGDQDTPFAQEPIGQLLVDAGLVTEEQLMEALSRQKVQGGKTFEILLALGHLDKDRLHAFLSRQPGIANIDLSRCNISPELIKLVPKKLAVDNLVLPIDQLGKLLTVAMACPLDVATIKSLEASTGLRVKAMLCKLEDIHTAVQKYYPERKKFDLSPSSFDNLPGASAPKEKVEEKLKKWNGMLLSAERIKALSEKIAADEVGPDLVAAIALNEPGFGAVLLRVANSELYTMRGQVDSIPMAVALLGKPAVLRILTDFMEPGEPRGLAVVEPWLDTCRRTAQLARELSRECGIIGSHAAYSLGLLADMGRMALAMVSPLQYKRVKAQLTGEQLSQAEHRLFTLDHCEAAGFLAMDWHYPVHMVRALQYHLTPDDAKEAEPLARMLGLASGLSSTNGADPEKKLAAFGSSIEKLGLAPDTVRRILQSAK